MTVFRFQLFLLKNGASLDHSDSRTAFLLKKQTSNSTEQPLHINWQNQSLNHAKSNLFRFSVFPLSLITAAANHWPGLQ